MERISNKLTFKNYYKIFLEQKKLEGVREKTFTNYDSAYKKFTTYFDENRPLTEILKNVYEGYIGHLRKLKLSINSISSYVKGLKTMLNYAMDEDYMKRFKMISVRPVKTTPIIYSLEEQEKLLVRPNLRTCSFAEHRNWVIVNTFLATGLRCATMRNIKIEDVDFDYDFIRLGHLKTGDEYVMPISERLKPILLEYIHSRASEPKEYLFPTVWNTKMTEGGFRTATERYNLKKGVKKTSRHLFRHTFSTIYVINGGDDRKLQSLLGHTTAEMTSRYVHVVKNVVLRQDFDKFNPLDCLLSRKGGKGEFIRPKRQRDKIQKGI